jgi:hypothetical protein
MDGLYNIYNWIIDNYVQLVLFCIVFLIVYAIEKLNNYNSLVYGFTPTLPIITQATNHVVQTIKKNKIGKMSKMGKMGKKKKTS